MFKRASMAVVLVASGIVAGGLVSPNSGERVDAVGICDSSNGNLGAGGEFHPVTPYRLYDSRDVGGPVASGADVNVTAVGRGGLPQFLDTDGDGTDDQVLAVAVSVTVANPTQSGYLTAFGKGAESGLSSIINFAPGQNVPNSAILRPGVAGELTLRVVQPQAAGTANVIVDVFGWFSSCGWNQRGARVVPVEPARIYDSRESRNGGVPVAGGQTVVVPVRGATGYRDSTSAPVTNIVPNSTDVVGAMVNITGVNKLTGSENTFISALPANPGATKPTTSNLNLQAGQTRAVMAIVPVGADGNIYLYNLSGATNLVVDVVGYLQAGVDVNTRAGRVVPIVAPYRALNTDDSAFGTRPLGPGSAEVWSFEKLVNSVTVGGSSVGNQLGMIGNLTAFKLARMYPTVPASTYLSAYPSSLSGVPQISNLNISENQAIPNMALLKYGANPSVVRDGVAQCTGPHCVTMFNLNGYLNYIYDVSAVILAD